MTRETRLYLQIALGALMLLAGAAALTWYAWTWTGRPMPWSGQIRRAEARELPNLPPPDLLRPLTPEAALAENESRPFDAVVGPSAPAFKLGGDETSKLRALECLTDAVYYEAASEGVDGGRAVAQVVLNRVRHPGFPNSVCGVVFQGWDRATGCQFSFTCDGSMARVPSTWAWSDAREIARQALAGKVYAPVGLSTHFHANYVSPYWSASLDKIAQVGRHIFYRLKAGLGLTQAFSQRYGNREEAPPSPTVKTIIDEAVASVEGSLPPPPAGLSPLPAMQQPIAPQDQPRVKPNDALVADSALGKLITDGATYAPRAAATAPKPKGCTDSARDRIEAVRPNDLSAGRATSNC